MVIPLPWDCLRIPTWLSSGASWRVPAIGESKKKKATFGNGRNVSSIRRLICNSEKGGGSTAEGARRLQGASVVREGEKYLFSFRVNTNYIIYSAAPVAPWPSAHRKPPLSPVSLTLTGGDLARHCWTWFQSTLCSRDGSVVISVAIGSWKRCHAT